MVQELDQYEGEHARYAAEDDDHQDLHDIHNGSPVNCGWKSAPGARSTAPHQRTS
jgi:hypothetical protein